MDENQEKDEIQKEMPSEEVIETSSIEETLPDSGLDQEIEVTEKELASSEAAPGENKANQIPKMPKDETNEKKQEMPKIPKGTAGIQSPYSDAIKRTPEQEKQRNLRLSLIFVILSLISLGLRAAYILPFVFSLAAAIFALVALIFIFKVHHENKNALIILILSLIGLVLGTYTFISTLSTSIRGFAVYDRIENVIPGLNDDNHYRGYHQFDYDDNNDFYFDEDDFFDEYFD